jgi:hypothetical protein
MTARLRLFASLVLAALLPVVLAACAPTVAPLSTATPVTPITRERAIDLATGECRIPSLVLVGAPRNIRAQLVTLDQARQLAQGPVTGGGLLSLVQMDGLLQLLGGPMPIATSGITPTPPAPWEGTCTVLIDATTGQPGQVTDRLNPNAPQATPRPAATTGSYPAALATVPTSGPTALPLSYPVPANPTPPAPQRLRVRNGGSLPILRLVVGFAVDGAPPDHIAFGDIAAGATTDYQIAPHGVLAYAAYSFQMNGRETDQVVADFMGMQPLPGIDFTYSVDYDPGRYSQNEAIRLLGVTTDK